MSNASFTEVATLMQVAAVDPTQWESALDAVSTFVGCAGVVLLSVQGRQRFAPCSSDLAGMMEDYFAGGWYLKDGREACVPLLKARGIVLDQDFQTADQIDSCDFYRGFLSRHKRKWFAGVGVEIDGDDWCLALQRSPADGPFGAGDIVKLRLVRGMLANTARLSTHVGRSWMGGLWHALSVMADPTIVFDVNGQVLYANNAAEALVGASITRQRDIRFNCARTTDAFNAMLRRALNPWLSHSPEAEPTITLGNRTFSCRATSLLRQERLIANDAAALVVMRPITQSPDHVMKSRYGLTNAETRVSLALAEGKSVSDIAAAFGVKDSTIRSQLKSVYHKTEMNTQSRLVALVRDVTSARLA